VEPCKQYRSTVEFNFIDSTALINLGDPCKRALCKVQCLPVLYSKAVPRSFHAFHAFEN